MAASVGQRQHAILPANTSSRPPGLLLFENALRASDARGASSEMGPLITLWRTDTGVAARCAYLPDNQKSRCSWWSVRVISLMPTAEGGNIQRHKRPARQQVRCVSLIYPNDVRLGRGSSVLCLSSSIRQILRSSNGWLSTWGRWGRGNGRREWGALGRKGEEGCDESRGCAAGHGETHMGVHSRALAFWREVGLWCGGEP